MSYIHLVRHGAHAQLGRVLSGRSEIALDETGQGEAVALSKVLGAEYGASLHSSPRLRACQTIAPLAMRLDRKVQVQSALDEIDFGDFTGLGFEELDRDPAWHLWNTQRGTARCPNGETMGEAVARAVDFLFALPPEPAVCVTHCDVIRGIVAHVLDMPMERIFMLECDPGSVTTLSIRSGQVKLVTLNRQPLR